jgi:hypothetical protein
MLFYQRLRGIFIFNHTGTGKTTMGINNRRWRYGAISTLITALVIAVVILLNVALTALFKRYPLNIDLTTNRIFALSAETKTLLASLSDDIGITVLNTEERFIATEPAAYFTQANELLHNYTRRSSRVRLAYIDLLRNPEFSSRYPELGLSENDVLITAGANARVLRAGDLFNIRASDYGAYVAASRAEQSLTSALLSVTSADRPRLAVVSGHSADEISAFTDLLRLNAWEITTLNLLTETPPPDIAVILLAGPHRDLSIEELRCLDNFLAAGDTHSFFYLLSPDQVSTPNLDAFLAEWGVAAIDGIVSGADTAYIVGASPFNTLADYADEHRADTLPMLPLSHPLTIVFDDERNRVVRALLRFPPTSAVRRIDDARVDDATATASTSNGIPALVLSEYARTA